jgi:hypothetical protein
MAALTVPEIYGVIDGVFTMHPQTFVLVLEGEFCLCGYNGPHRNHQILEIIRGLQRAEKEKDDA